MLEKPGLHGERMPRVVQQVLSGAAVGLCVRKVGPCDVYVCNGLALTGQLCSVNVKPALPIVSVPRVNRATWLSDVGGVACRRVARLI